MFRFLLTCLLLLPAAVTQAEVIDIESAEAAKLSAMGIPVIDVRTAPEWEDSGVVPGSHLLTFFDEQGKADPATWLAKAKGFSRPADPVIVICRSGKRSKAASQFLSQEAGYAKVYNVKHGIIGWIRENHPTTPAAPVLASCRKAKTC